MGYQNFSLSNFCIRDEHDNFIRGASLRSSALLEYQNPLQNNFNSGGEDYNLMGGPRRANLRNSALLEHQNPSQSNFNNKGEHDNLMNEAKRASLRGSAFRSIKIFYKVISPVKVKMKTLWMEQRKQA